LAIKIAFGRASLLRSPQEGRLCKEGEVLVTDITNPDWDPILKRAAAIVTNKGGRTSHAAIVGPRIGHGGHCRLRRCNGQNSRRRPDHRQLRRR
jgi:pyruvate,water dikinase